MATILHYYTQQTCKKPWVFIFHGIHVIFPTEWSDELCFKCECIQWYLPFLMSLVQAPSRLTMFKCCPTWLNILSSRIKAFIWLSSFRSTKHDTVMLMALVRVYRPKSFKKESVSCFDTMLAPCRRHTFGHFHCHYTHPFVLIDSRGFCLHHFTKRSFTEYYI